MLSNILLVLHLVIAVAIVILVLLQQGKGSDMGAAFGGGSSQSLFGARGAANFLSRSTSLLVAMFFLSSMTLAYIYTHQSRSTRIVTDSVVAPQSGEDIPLESPDSLEVFESSEELNEAGESDIPATPQ